MNGLYDEIRIAMFSVWNRRWLALAIAWVLCILGWVAVSTQPNSYESEARILVDAQNILSDQTGITSGERFKAIEKLSQTIVSYSNVQKVVTGTDLGLKVTTDKQMDGAVKALQAKVEVETSDENVFDIKVEQSSPKLARDVVQKLIDIIQEENIAGDRNSVTQEIEFLDGQVAEAQKTLNAVEAKRITFETENLGLLPGVGSVSQRVESARSEINQIDSQLVSAQSALVALDAQLAAVSPTVSTPAFNSGSPGGGGAAGALAAARGELAAMRSRGLTDRHPDVVSMRKQIETLRAQVASSPSSGGGSSVISTPNPAYSSLQGLRAERRATVAGLRTRRATLQAELAQLTSQQSLEPGVASEMEKLNREYDIAKDQYDQLIIAQNKARLRDNIGIETDAVKFSIIAKPTLPTVPSAPNRPLLLTIVFFFGLGGGVACAFALGHLQTSFPTASRLERVSGLPVIGTVSQMLTPQQKAVRLKKLKMFIGGTASLVGVFVLLIVVEFFQRGIAV